MDRHERCNHGSRKDFGCVHCEIESLRTERDTLAAKVSGLSDAAALCQRNMEAAEAKVKWMEPCCKLTESAYAEYVLGHDELELELKAAEAIAERRGEAVPLLAEALLYIIGIDWSNGVTDPTGSIDEGDVVIGRFVSRVEEFLARAALTEQPTDGESAGEDGEDGC